MPQAAAQAGRRNSTHAGVTAVCRLIIVRSAALLTALALAGCAPSEGAEIEARTSEAAKP